MNINNYFFDLLDREILEISGQDSKSFIQGIITNNIGQQEELTYALVLNAQGKILHECFVFFLDCDKIYIDIDKNHSENFLNLLSNYKFCEDVNFNRRNDIFISVSSETISTLDSANKLLLCHKDPRSEKLGNRLYSIKQQHQPLTKNKDQQNNYLICRIKNKIIDVEADLECGKTFPADIGLDADWAICKNKKCYLGQEQVAKIRFMNLSKRGLFFIEGTKNQVKLPKKGSSIFSSTKEKIGKMCSSHNTLGLAIMHKEKLKLKNITSVFSEEGEEMEINY